MQSVEDYQRRAASYEEHLDVAWVALQDARDRIERTREWLAGSRAPLN